MIKLQEMTPEVYYKQSRDFQFIGRLYDLVLNSVKTNADLLYNLPFNDNSDEQLLDLLALTLGFKAKHQYNAVQLKALCSAFCEILKNKGNIQSIWKAIYTLLYSEGITEEPEVEMQIDLDTGLPYLDIKLPTRLNDLNLLYDLFDYILPAGLSYKLVQISREEYPAATKLAVSNINVKVYGKGEDTDPCIKVNDEISKIPTPTDYADTRYISNKPQTVPGLFTSSMIYQGDAMEIANVEKEEKANG